MKKINLIKVLLLSSVLTNNAFSLEINATKEIKKAICADFKYSHKECPENIVKSTPKELYNILYDLGKKTIENKEYMISKMGIEGYNMSVGLNITKAGFIAYYDLNDKKNGYKLIELGCKYDNKNPICPELYQMKP